MGKSAPGGKVENGKWNAGTRSSVAEQASYKRWVVGSIPTGCTIKICGFSGGAREWSRGYKILRDMPSKILKNSLFTAVALVAIVALGAFLHFLNISYPARPVFDEAHFAMYAADYVKHIPFFDIHPPLGKLIYAAALSLAATPQNTENTDFITIKSQKEAGGNDIVVVDNNLPFGNFPYVLLRSVGAVFGVLLAVAFFWFLKSVGIPDVGALLGALFVTLENALLVETRLILMNGMFLVLGFAALAMYFKKPPWPVVAGVVFGLSLGVKMIGIVFAGPVLFSWWAAKKMEAGAEERACVRQFAVAAALTFLLIFSVNYIIFTPAENLGALKSLGIISYAGLPRLSYLVALFIDFIYSLGNYVVGNSNALQSPWYFWPAMQVPMTYFYETVGNGIKEIVLSGNPAVWYASTLAAICALALLPRYLKKFLWTKNFEENKPFFILLAGFISSLLPFATIVRRSTFLYHYFPALIFAIGLLAWFIVKALKIGSWDALNIRQILALAVVVVLSFAGFLYAAPLTYGL